MHKLPETYLENMKKIFTPEEYEAYLDSFHDKRVYGLRVNTNKISVEEFLEIAPFQLERIPWTENGFYYDEREKPGKHPFYYAGLYYLQEPSAMTPAAALPVDPEDFVLDLCAAPGGKSTALACKIGKKGCLVSNDISVSRAQALLKNLELFGVSNSIILSEDGKKLEKYFPETFDKILIDAPCSGEGMFRKEPAVIRSHEEHGNLFYVNLQKQIVESALKMLKPGGMLLYSTCTFSPLENEEIICYMKTLCPELILCDLSNRFEGFMPGRFDLVEIYAEQIPKDFQEQLSRCARIYPFKVKGEGHFVALLKKGEKPLEKSRISGGNVSKIPEEAREFLKKVSFDFSNGNFELRNEKLYFIPRLNIDMKGLHILRQGLLLGECKKNRFEPAQALSMALKKEEFDQVLDLKLSDPRVLKYLKGETLEGTQKGYVLILVEGHPLGFAKGDGKRLKNKYLKGWRYL